MEKQEEYETIDLSKLKEPFPANKIHWRVGATNIDREGKLKWGDKPQGIPLAYIDARDLYQRLDEVCGPANWQPRYPWSDGKRLYCEIGIKVNGEWIWKGNGAGDTDVEAEKGAFSDAVKRAGVPWGIAQYLYDLPNTWVELEKKGKSYEIKDKKNLTERLIKWQENKFKEDN